MNEAFSKIIANELTIVARRHGLKAGIALFGAQYGKKRIRIQRNGKMYLCSFNYDDGWMKSAVTGATTIFESHDEVINPDFDPKKLVHAMLSSIIKDSEQ